MEIQFFHPNIKDFLDALDTTDLTRVRRIFGLFEAHGNKVGFPYSRALGNRLFEIRTRGKVDVRLLYTFYKGQVVVLHAFVKKSMQIRPSDLFLARTRLRQLDNL